MKRVMRKIQFGGKKLTSYEGRRTGKVKDSPAAVNAKNIRDGHATPLGSTPSAVLVFCACCALGILATSWDFCRSKSILEKLVWAEAGNGKRASTA